MARTNNLTNFLTDVAGAIKTKKGSQTAIQAANFDTEILALPSQGTYQEKTVTITQNGQTTLTPDTGYDAMDQVEITVNVPIKQLQSKTVSVTSNGNVTLLPDTDYDGFNEVSLNVNVDPNAVNYQIYTAAYIGQDSTVQRDVVQYSNYKQIEIDLLPYINRTIIITNTGDRNFYGFTSVKPEDKVVLNNPRQSASGGLTYKYTGGNDRYLVYDFTASDQADSVISVRLASVELIEKNITTNGVYNAEDDSADGFSKVTVNVPSGSGDVKLFETEQAMQADPSPQEGDLAIVYRDELTGVTEESEFDSCIFPQTVVLSEAFSGNINGSFRSTGSGYFEGMVNLSSSDFRFNSFGGTMISVQYTSNDGITYTRTDGGEELQEFGTTIKWSSWGSPFNNVIGNFMKRGGMVFEGLYEYKTNQYVMTKNQLDTTPDYVYEKTFYGKNGVENGTLTTGVSNSFTDVNAEVYAKIQAQYNNMQQRVLTDQDKTINESINIIPCKSDGTPLLDTSNVTNMRSMFTYCKSLTTIPLLDTSNVTNMNNTFSSCSSLTSIPLLDTSNVTNMRSMFGSCSNLTTIPLLNTSNVTSMGYMFSGCSSLTTIPLLDTSNVTDMDSMFTSCSNLTSIPLLDASNVTNMDSMFAYCKSLTTIPLLDTSNVTNMRSMFGSCSNLTTIPLLNTSNVTSMGYMFSGCSSLTTIPLLDTSNVTNMNSTFSSCSSLNNESLNNILYMCANAAKITSNKTLKYIGLTQEQATTCQSLSNYSAFIAAGWTTGY